MPGLSAWALDLGVGPINGDFELVEAGVAFAIFAFLPLCQISAGHASVDIFTAKLPMRINRVLQLGIDVIFAIVLISIAYQLYNGMLSKQSYGDTTFLVGLCREPVRSRSHSGDCFLCGGYSRGGMPAW